MPSHRFSLAAALIIFSIAELGCTANDVTQPDAARSDGPIGGSTVVGSGGSAGSAAGTGGSGGSTGLAGAGGAGGRAEPNGVGGATGGGGRAGAAGAAGRAGSTGAAGATGAGGRTGAAGMGGRAGSTGAAGMGGRAGSGGAAGAAGRAGTGGAAAGGGGASGIGGAGGTGGVVRRPAFNTGAGFFTLNGKLYDANGVEFQMVGVNTVHYDENWASCTSNCGIPNARASVNRMGVPLWSGISAQTIQNLMNKMISAHIVPVPGVWYVDGSYEESSNVTCQETSAPGSAFDTAVNQWVARASLFKPFEKYMLLNIANEWGPADSVVWRDAYVSAVSKLRAAGYLCTLVIDAGGCGQDVSDVVKYAKAIYESDPQHNIVFDEHIYGLWATIATGEESWQTDVTVGFAQMQSTGLPILIGEFGPGKNVGPSPTAVTPGTIIQAARAHGFGWLAWAWDDGYGQGATGFELSNQGAFSLTNGAPTNGNFPNNTDLSAYGNEVVLNPTYGTFATAKAATIF